MASIGSNTKTRGNRSIAQPSGGRKRPSGATTSTTGMRQGAGARPRPTPSTGMRQGR